MCFFTGVLHDEIYHQNEFFGSLTQQTENHRGGDDSGSAAKIIPPYIKFLLFNIITCAFLQVFYRMRYITRMSFMGLWSSKLKIIGGDDFVSAAKIIPPYIKCLILIIITCAFLQVFYRMRCITRMSFMGLWSSKLKIIGGDDFGSAAKIIPPYIKCLILIIITCAFLQVFYRMRCITRMSFMGLWRCKLEIIGGGWWFRQCCQNHTPLHKMLNFDYNHFCFFAGVLQDEIYHQNEFYKSLTGEWFAISGISFIFYFFAYLNKWPMKTWKSTRITARP